MSINFFPHPKYPYRTGPAEDKVEWETGISVRDRLAGMALQGLVGSSRVDGMSADDVAEVCFEYADSMLKRGKA